MAIFEEEDETIIQKGLELIEIVPSECTSFEDKDIEYRDIEYFLELYRKNKKPSPIWVREFENTYQVIYGHHRFYTAKLIGIQKHKAYLVPNDKIKIVEKIDISVYMLFFLAQILWIIDALMDNDYLLLSAYTINIIIYFYIFYYYHNKCHGKPSKMG